MDSSLKSSALAFNSEFRIGNKVVGPGCPVLIIAEAGVSHFGDMKLALELVAMAVEAGADVFKTQFYDVEQLYAASASDWRSRLRSRSLSLDQAKELQTACHRAGLQFMSTAHDESRIPWLIEMNVPALKIGSGERNNTPFIRRLAELGKPMIISTGMHRDEDVLETLDACAAGGCRDIALLHCVTSYPTPSEQVNLSAMDRLKSLFPGPVGYSDHTADFLAAYAAVARGARVIEKHITILRDVPDAQDWKVSAGPDNFKEFVGEIRRIESMLGDGRKTVSACEAPAETWALKSLVASRSLDAGEVLRAEHLLAKRPGVGIPPSQIALVIGRRLAHPVAMDAAIQLDDLEPLQ
jgi:N-acetylneuraminate synthase/N,N'-diacetyllegionaminate synthase